MSSTNIEVGIVGSDMQFKVLKPSQVKDYLDEVE
jgi:hypothetical protein